MPIYNTRRKAIFIAILLALSFFRFSYLGFRYTPYLDDHIQYYFYPSFESPWERILIGGAGVLFTRPLAGLFDFFVWSLFKNHLGVAVAVISLLHGLSALLFCKAFSRIGIKLGLFFIVFYLFFPVNTEGTYWLSASTRIVVSLFFISMSLTFLANNKTLLFAIFNLASLWFYEQTAILALTTGIVFSMLCKNPRKALIPALNFVILVAFYLYWGKHGDNAHRLGLISFQKLIPHTIQICRQAIRIITTVSWKLCSIGLIRGINRIYSDLAFLWVGVWGLLTVIFLMVAEVTDKNPIKTKIIFGSIFALVPILPFLFTEGNSINLRNIVPCLLGIAMIIDALLPVLFRSLTPVFAGVCLIIFSIITVTEVCDYEMTAQHDLKVAQKISQSLPENADEITVRLSVPVYLPQNAPFGDHIKSMVGSDWGVTGIVRTVSGNRTVVVNVITRPSLSSRK